jgi:hypothetical protein
VKDKVESRWNEVHYVASGDDVDISHGLEDVYMAMFSLSGSFLASADSKGRVLLWDTDSRNALSVLHNSSTQTAWCGLLWRDVCTVMLLHTRGWTAVTVPGVIASHGTEESTEVTTQMEETPYSQIEGAVEDGRPSHRTNVRVDDDDDISLGENPSEHLDEEDVSESVAKIRKQIMRQDTLVTDPIDVIEDVIEEEQVDVYNDFPAQVDLQASFQSSSTSSDDYQRRYLVWNGVGSIVTRDEGVSNRVEIRFANTLGKNKQETFPDTNKFSMASLGYEGAIFATEVSNADLPEGANAPGSIIYYHAFPGQKTLEGANEDFTLNLLPEENALSLAVGRGWCAVATSRNLLRVFSSTGLQLAVTTLPGPVVSITGAGCRLAIVCHSGAPLDDTPQLRVQLVELTIEGRCRHLATTALAITPQSTLTWLGFDPSGLLHVMDSSGTLSSLMHLWDWQSVPVLDTSLVRKSVDHVYWPVCVKSGGRLVYVLLNGETKPAVYPQPITSVKAYHPPVLELEGGKDKTEMNDKARNFTVEAMLRCHQVPPST